MDLKLKGKKVLVTGSSRGIGLATALEFAREGSSVCFSSRNPNVQELKAMLESDAERHLFERCDFTSPHAVGRLREAVAKQWSSLDVLVCNVGSGRGSAEALPDWELFQENFLLNFASVYHSIQSFLDDLIRAQGSIVIVGSIAGQESLGAPLSYTTAKAALAAFSKDLSRRLAPKGVRINMLSPGNILHDGGSWQRKHTADPESVNAYIEKEVPLRRFGRPDEIARAIVFLASEQAAFTTGSNWLVDGGQTKSLR